MSEILATDVSWILSAAFRIMMMQGGFALLEAGSVRYSNVVNIMMKNMVDMGLGALIFGLTGYALYAGSGNAFMGLEYFSTVNIDDFAHWIFNFSFAATASTIDSGAVAERMQFMSYIGLSMFTTGFVYPIAARSFWHQDGIFANMGVGVHDFAGSGAVHLLGGVSACVAAYMLGPRRAVYQKKIAHASTMFTASENEVLQLYGTFILAVSWLSFNCGSVGAISGDNAAFVASKVAVNTIIGGSAGMFAGMILSYYWYKRIVVPLTTNPFLGALVAITANCDVIKPHDSFIIGFTSIGACLMGWKFLEKVGVDDPLTAIPVHGFCGIYAMITTGLFSHDTGLFYTGSFEALGVQIAATLFVIAFTSILTYLFLKLINRFEPIRVKSYEEDVGLDFSEHGVNSIEVARNKLTEAFAHYCDTLDDNSVHNPFRNLLEACKIDVHNFHENWTMFVSMFASTTEENREHAEVALASMFDFLSDDQKQVYVKKSTAKIAQMLEDDNSDSVHSVIKHIADNEEQMQAMKQAVRQHIEFSTSFSGSKKADGVEG